MTASRGRAEGDGATHAERTALAWRRTGATFFVVALAVVRMVLSRTDPAVVLLAAAGLAAAVLAAVIVERRQRDPLPGAGSALFPAAITVSVVLVASAGLVDLMVVWID